MVVIPSAVAERWRVSTMPATDTRFSFGHSASSCSAAVVRAPGSSSISRKNDNGRAFSDWLCEAQSCANSCSESLGGTALAHAPPSVSIVEYRLGLDRSSSCCTHSAIERHASPRFSAGAGLRRVYATERPAPLVWSPFLPLLCALLAKRPLRAMRRSRIVLSSTILITALVACVGSRGSVTVGMPHVNTRERLITERNERAKWLRTELKSSEEIEPTIQGFRDIRSLAAIYSDVRATIDPEAGRLDAQEADNEALRLEAENWRLRREVQQEKQNFDAVANPGTGTVTEPAEPSEPGGFRDLAGPPDTSPKFDRDRGLIDAADTIESKAEVHPLDRFRDRLALRNAIEAELRETQFDDSHDILGSELYGLTLDLTVVPGKWSEEFVEVEVTVEARDSTANEVRIEELDQLYVSWLEGLPELIERDVQSWFRELECLLSESTDEGCASRSGRAAQQRLNEHVSTIRRALVSRERRHAAANRLLEEGGDAPDRAHERAFLRSGDPRWLDEDVRKKDYVAPRLFSGPKSERSEVVLQGQAIQSLDVSAINDAGWLTQLLRIVIVHEYQVRLSRLARIWLEDIGQPLVLVEEPASDSLQLISVGSETGRGAGSGERAAVPSIARFVEEDAAALDGYILLGRKEFARLLLSEERGIEAYAAQPKELAQSISDVAARESIVNSIAAIQAILPNSGGSGSAQFELLQKTQERFHGILRQPLVVGFSRGKSGLGWVLGPKFDLDKGGGDFRHAPSRYDVSASIVAPAWVPRVNLSGNYHWIHARGGPASGGQLWGGEHVVVHLPQPSDLLERVTRAVLERSMLHTPTGLNGISRRPRPEVWSPAVHAGRKLLSGKNRTLLILGEELWRSPSVFVGGQQADSVTVTSDMRGLLAHFDRLEFPDLVPDRPYADSGRPTDLTVVTTYGRANVIGAVTIQFDPDSERGVFGRPSARARLATTFLQADAASKRSVAFDYARPKAFDRLVLRLVNPVDGQASDTTLTSGGWDATGTRVTIATDATKWPGGTDPAALEVELLRIDRPGESAGTRVSPGDRPQIAVFPDEKSRAFVAASDTIALALDASGNVKDDSPLRFYIDDRNRAVFSVAYPGFFASLQDGGVRAVVGDVTLVVRSLGTAKGRFGIEVPKSQIRDHRKALVKQGSTANRIQLEYTSRRPALTPRSERIPIYKEKAVEVTASQSPSEAEMKLLTSAIELPVRERASLALLEDDGTTVLPVVALLGSRTDLDENFPHWRRPGEVTLSIRGKGPFVCEWIGSPSDERHDFALRIPSSYDAGLVAPPGGREVGAKISEKDVALKPSQGSGTATLTFTRKEQAKFAVSETTLERASPSVVVRVELPADKERDLRHDVLNHRLTISLSRDDVVQEFHGQARLHSDLPKIICEFPIPDDARIWPTRGAQADAKVTLGSLSGDLEIEPSTITLKTP